MWSGRRLSLSVTGEHAELLSEGVPFAGGYLPLSLGTRCAPATVRRHSKDSFCHLNVGSQVSDLVRDITRLLTESGVDVLPLLVDGNNFLCGLSCALPSDACRGVVYTAIPTVFAASKLATCEPRVYAVLETHRLLSAPDVWVPWKCAELEIEDLRDRVERAEAAALACHDMLRTLADVKLD